MILASGSHIFATAGAAPPSGAPLILYVDAPEGPTAGGEFGLGTYLNIFGIFPGAFLNSDGSTNVAVTIGGVAVANFRCVVPFVGNGVAGVTGLGLNAITRIGVQVGPLTGLTQNGTYYPIVVTIGGVSPRNPQSGGFYLDQVGDQIAYCPNPGYIVFVDTVNGNDSNPGTFASPYKTFQQFNSGTSVFTGAIFGSVGGGAPTQTNCIQPGTVVVGRATGVYQDLSFQGRLISGFRLTGTAPNGATPSSPVTVNGVSCRASGPITITSYPGPINGNAPEQCYNNETSSGSGGYNGNDSARGNETTTWGTTGWAKYFYFLNFRIDVPAGAPSDGAPINLQTNAEFNRVVNCHLGPWPSNIEALAGGIAGYGNGTRYYGNYITGIQSSTGQENHGIYYGSNTGGTLTGSQQGGVHFRIGYNVITACYGNCIMIRGSNLTSESAADCPFVFNNWLDATVGKHTVDFPDNRIQIWFLNNVCIQGEAGLFTEIDSGVTSVNNGLSFINNLVYGWRTYGAFVTADPATMHKNYENNICLQVSGQVPADPDFFNQMGSANQAFTNNVYYDPNGVATSLPSGDTTGHLGNPLLVSVSTQNFVPGSSSPAVNFGQTPELSGTVTLDFNFLTRPQGSNTKIAAGPYERPGG